MPDLLVEALVAARFEQARCVADVLLRRTRLGLLAGGACLQDEDAVQRGRRRRWRRELGWDRRQVKREAERWLEAAEARSRSSAPCAAGVLSRRACATS